MKRLALAVVVVLALVAGGLALTGRGPFAPGGVLSGGGTPPPGGTIAPVPESDAVVSDGEVVPLRSAALGASVAGRVITVTTEGTSVAAGDVVLRLDPAQADAAVALAAAALPVADAQATQASALSKQASEAVAVVKAGVTQAKAAWNVARAQRDQLPSGASSAQKRAANSNVDAASAALTAARAQVNVAQRSADAAAAGAAAAGADSKRAAAALDQAKATRAQLDVVAPFAGVVSSVGPAVGEFVAPGAILVRVADASAWRVETTDMDETAIARIHVGSSVSLTLDAYPGITFGAVVREIGAYGESRQGDIVYRVLVEPTDALPANVRWNMTASVTISTK